MMAPFYLVPNPRNTHLAILIQRSFAPLEAAPIGGQPFAQDISRRDCTAFLLLFDTYDTRLLAQALSIRPSRRTVLPEDTAERTGDLAERRELRQGLLHRVEKVLGTFGRILQAGEGLLDGRVVPALLELREPFLLPLADGLVDGVKLHGGAVGPARGVAVDASDDTFISLDLPLVAVGGVFDLKLHKALLDGIHRASHLVDTPYVGPGCFLDCISQRLDVVGAGERVRRVCQAALARQDLLGSEGDARAPLRREPECLVEGVGVQALSPAEDRGERLDRGSHDVVLGLLGG